MAVSVATQAPKRLLTTSPHLARRLTCQRSVPHRMGRIHQCARSQLQ